MAASFVQTLVPPTASATDSLCNPAALVWYILSPTSIDDRGPSVAFGLLGSTILRPGLYPYGMIAFRFALI